jgi:hypothetical protein
MGSPADGGSLIFVKEYYREDSDDAWKKIDFFTRMCYTYIVPTCLLLL